MEEIFIVDGETAESVEKQMKDALEHIKTVQNENKKEKESEVSFSNGGAVFYNGQTANVSPDISPHSDEFALVINGHSLVIIFNIVNNADCL